MNTELTVFNHDGVEVVDSREVAEMMGKQHKDLMKSIHNYIKFLEKSTERNFAPSDFFVESSYKDSTGRTLPCYLITKCGCDMVAHKMTGEKGVLFTATYVKAFEAMREKLALQQAYNLPQDYVSALKALVQSEEEKLKLEEDNKHLTLENNVMRPKARYYDLIMQSDEIIPITIIAKDYGMSAYRMNKILEGLGVQYKVGNTWVLYSKYQGFGYVASETKLKNKKSGTSSRVETKWTQKGRAFLYYLLKENGYIPLIEQNENVIEMSTYVQ